MSGRGKERFGLEESASLLNGSVIVTASTHEVRTFGAVKLLSQSVIKSPSE